MCSRPKKRWITTSLLNASSGKAAKALPRSASETTRHDRSPIPRDGAGRDSVSVCIPVRPWCPPNRGKTERFLAAGREEAHRVYAEGLAGFRPGRRRRLEPEGHPT